MTLESGGFIMVNNVARDFDSYGVNNPHKG